MRSNPRSEEVIEIGKRIRDIRTNKKMSQADLADKANISLSQVSDIETGKSSMRLTTFIGIVEALQVSADVLLRTDIPEVNNIYKSEFAELLEPIKCAYPDVIWRCIPCRKSWKYSKNLPKPK